MADCLQREDQADEGDHGARHEAGEGFGRHQWQHDEKKRREHQRIVQFGIGQHRPSETVQALAQREQPGDGDATSRAECGLDDAQHAHQIGDEQCQLARHVAPGLAPPQDRHREHRTHRQAADRDQQRLAHRLRERASERE